MKLLVAEDNVTMRQMLGRLLASRGIECTLAEDGESVVAAWERESFDLILMDVQMPTMDGLEATRIIRHKEQARGGHVPIVAMTAHTMPEDQQECFQAGMDSYLSKPIMFDELFALLAELGLYKEQE